MTTSFTVEELENYSPQTDKKNYSESVTYQGQEISPINHPSAIANYLLNVVQHTKMAGLIVQAPMGRGKSTICTVIAHHIHTKKPEFNVVWGTSDDFINLKEFFSRQPQCQPICFIFDDITGSTKSISDKEMNQNFNILTKVRWQIDPTGKTPVIILCNSHYSKNLEKQYRSVLGASSFADITNEEKTNFDTIAPKGTLGRACLEKFARIADVMFTKHEFFLKSPNKKKWTRYETDKPLRPFVTVTGNGGYITVYDEKDCCNTCSKTKTRRFVEPKVILENIKKAYGGEGKKALRLALYRRGHYKALGKKIEPASRFIESILADVETDYDELVNEIYRDSKIKPPEKTRRYIKKEKESLLEIESAITEKPLEG